MYCESLSINSPANTNMKINSNMNKCTYENPVVLNDALDDNREVIISKFLKCGTKFCLE